MVLGPSRDQMYDLGKKFGQESVIYSEHGKPELLYTNGPDAGYYHPYIGHEFFHTPPGDYYTHMPENNGYLRMAFDWDKKLPAKLGARQQQDAWAQRQRGITNQAVGKTEMNEKSPWGGDCPHLGAGVSYSWKRMSPGAVLVSRRSMQKSETPVNTHNLESTGSLNKTENPMSEKFFEENEWKQLLLKSVQKKVSAYAEKLRQIRERELKKSLEPAPAPKLSLMDTCPGCGQEDRPGMCQCLVKSEHYRPLTKTELEKKHIGFKRLEGKIEREGYSKKKAAAITASIGRKKYGAKGMAEKAAAGRAHKSEMGPYDSNDQDVGMMKADAPKPPKRPDNVKESGRKICSAPGCNKVVKGKDKCSAHMNKSEMRAVESKTKFKATPDEPVKTQEGSGGKVTKGKGLNKGDYGMSENGRAATTPTQAMPAPMAPKKKFGLADLKAGKQKLVGAGVKPISNLGMKH